MNCFCMLKVPVISEWDFWDLAIFQSEKPETIIYLHKYLLVKCKHYFYCYLFEAFSELQRKYDKVPVF